jgi:hypothetical protein
LAQNNKTSEEAPDTLNFGDRLAGGAGLDTLALALLVPQLASA